MARIFAIERRLGDWAIWQNRRPHSAVSCSGAGDDDVKATERAVHALPSPLRETVEQCYLADGGMAEHASRLGCPHWTVTRRIGRAHRMLEETFVAARDGAMRLEERAFIASQQAAVMRVDA